LAATGSWLGYGARGCAEEEARREAVACDWCHGSPVVVAASRVGASDGAEQEKDDESDFTSSMGHSGEGIRVIGWLEAVGRARGRDSVNRGRGQTVGGGGRRGRQGRPLVRE
jgi:hypothetical protein